MKEIINELKKDCLFTISNWWGLRDAGTSGIIVTKDNTLYSYTMYYTKTKFLEDNNIPQESISNGVELTDKQIEIIEKFIETEICNKNFENIRIFDAGWNVSGNYNGNNFNIVNHHDLYVKAKDLLENIKGVKKNVK